MMCLSACQPAARRGVTHSDVPVMFTAAVPDPSVLTFPRSPTCRSESSGPPWFFFRGLKWAPAEVHPLLHCQLACAYQGSDD